MFPLAMTVFMQPLMAANEAQAATATNVPFAANVASTAALIHQALVYQGKINSLPTDVAATNYIVHR